jgi:hypothetical protein
MKKQLILLGFSIFAFAVTTASAQGKSGKKEDKQVHQNKSEDKSVKKDHPGNSNQDKIKGNSGNNNGNQGHNGNQSNNGNNGNKANKGNQGEKSNQGKNDEARGRNEEGYKWDRETFKDRKKIRNQEKVTICHKPDAKDEPGVTIKVSANAVKAHMNHGDLMGVCPAVKDNRYSNDFLEKRTGYYTTLEDTREQVVYSRSVLDYALERLAASRIQLAAMQANKVPLVEIQRKQVVVTELEQNVSLLETLIGTAANLLVNKLTN